MKTRVINYGTGAVALLMIFVLSVNTYACACCSNGGEWAQRADRVQDHHLADLDSLPFGPLANTYMTEAGEDGIEGIASVADKYNLSLRKAGRRWTLTFKDEQGRTGTLSFTIPATMVAYVVDPYGGEKTAGGAGPTLYHEWRFSGPVTGTGIFKKGMIGRPKFQLVLQGTSNMCIDSAGFHNWNLQISGPRADYSFYGSFKTNANAPENAADQNPEKDAASNQDQAVGKVMLALVEAWNNAATRELTAAMA
jgi:hypothetical protein